MEHPRYYAGVALPITVEANSGLLFDTDREIRVDHSSILTRWNEFINYEIGEIVSVASN